MVEKHEVEHQSKNPHHLQSLLNHGTPPILMFQK